MSSFGYNRFIVYEKIYIVAIGALEYGKE